MNRKAFIMSCMVKYDMPDMKRIKHAMKVAGFAEAIAATENIDDDKIELLSCAAILHDIGIHMAERIYNTTSDFYQQKLGPSVAATFLEQAGFSTEEQGEICYLIAHHHTYNMKDNVLLQILIEANTLVNAQEGDLGGNLETVEKDLFVTETGKMFYEGLILGKEVNE